MKDLNISDLAYIAGLIDGEGCIYVTNRKSRGRYTMSAGLNISSTTKNLIEWLHEVTGIGSITCQKRNQDRWKPMYKWNVAIVPSANLLSKLETFLKIKQKQANLLIELKDIKSKSSTNFKNEYSRQLEIFTEMKNLNKRGV